MAIVKNNPYPDVPDYFGAYQTWKPIVLPSGETVYEVPGHPERVFVPSLSNASGKVVLRPNPKNDIDKQAEEDARIKKLQDQQAANASPAGQLLPAAASIGGTIGAAKLVQAINAPASPISQIGANAGNQAANAAAQGAQQQAANQAAQQTGSQVVASQGAQEGGNEIVASQAPGLLEAAPGSYGASYLPSAGVTAGAYTGYQQAKGLNNVYHGKELDWKQRVALALPTFGASLFSNKVPGFVHQSTRDVAREHTGQLLEQAGDDKNAQAYIQGMREQYNSAPPDPSKPFFNGKYGSFDEYQTAGLDAGDLSGVYGNLNLGPAYANLDQEKKKAFTQSQIDKGNYISRKGEVEFKDKDAAAKDFETFNKGFQVAAAAAMPTTPAQAAAAGAQSVRPVVKPLVIR